MENANKKIAAALAAVNCFLQEEQIIYQQGSGSVAERLSPSQETNIWGLSGRQDMMSLRQLIQMKAFSRF